MQQSTNKSRGLQIEIIKFWSLGRLQLKTNHSFEFLNND